MTRTSVQWRSLVWVAGSAVGTVVVALPDADERVFSLSRTHGPSAIDLLGMVVLIASWLPVALLLPALWRSADKVAARLAEALAILGVVGLAVTISADMGWSWLVAVAALVAAQVVLVADGWRRASGDER